MTQAAAFLQVRNWEKFQAYKDGRGISWIKLYIELQDRSEYGRLPDATKAHITGLWMLAARLNNKLPADAEWLGRRLNATEYVDLAALVRPEDGEGWLESHTDTPGAVAEILASVRSFGKTVPRGEEKRVEEIPVAIATGGSIKRADSNKPTAVPSKQSIPFNGIVAEASDDWTARYNGAAPGGKIASALGRLFKPTRNRAPIVALADWPERVRPSWRRYLREAKGQFVDPFRFVDTFGDWDVGPEKPAPQALEWPDDPAAASAWERVLEALQPLVQPHSFATWLRPTVGAALHGQQLVIRVPNEQFRSWVIGNYTALVAKAQKAAGTNYALTFEFEPPAAVRAAS